MSRKSCDVDATQTTDETGRRLTKPLIGACGAPAQRTGNDPVLERVQIDVRAPDVRATWPLEEARHLDEAAERAGGIRAAGEAEDVDFASRREPMREEVVGILDVVGEPDAGRAAREALEPVRADAAVVKSSISESSGARPHVKTGQPPLLGAGRYARGGIGRSGRCSSRCAACSRFRRSRR